MASMLVLACKERAQTQDDVAALAFDPTLGHRFDAAAAGLSLRETEAPESALRWQPPSCELEYQFRVTLDIEMLGEASKLPSSGLRIDGGWTAQADGSRMLLRNREVLLSHVQGGTQRPGIAEPAGALAEIRLETDGLAWTEVDGPTSLWSAFGSWMGLMLFYPAVPERTTAGERGTWSMLVHDGGAGVRVEAERGNLELPDGYEFAEPASQVVPVHVELQRWIDIAGTRAAVLRSRFEIGDSSPLAGGLSLFASLAGDKTGEAQFVVLDSGVLLHAELHERTNVKMRMGLGKSMRQLHTMHAEARLIRGCAGPVLPSFPDEQTAAERALELVVALRQHAAANELERVSALLEPELTLEHPHAARCLIATLQQFGPRALGTPELPMNDDVWTDGERVILKLPVRLTLDGGQEDIGEVALTVNIEGTQAWLASITLRRSDDEGPLLHILASQELIAAAECTDLDPPPDTDR